jgi:hypothetical protein
MLLGMNGRNELDKSHKAEWPDGHYWVRFKNVPGAASFVARRLNGEWVASANSLEYMNENYEVLYRVESAPEINSVRFKPLLDDSERLAQASGKITSVEAFFLRSIASNWIGVDEVVICNPNYLAKQVLKALDAIAIVHGNEATTAQFDREFAELRKRSEG